MNTAKVAKKSRTADLPKIIVRLPEDVKAWLDSQVDAYQSNQASEVVRALRERMERTDQRTAA